jgi:hypothetical protein
MLINKIVSLLQNLPVGVTNGITYGVQSFPIASDLEAIVSKNALFSSFITNIRQEVTFERVVFQLTNIHYNHSIYLIGSILVVYLYGQWRFFDGNTQKNAVKLRTFKRFTITERIARELIFVIIILLFKDIEPAI